VALAAIIARTAPPSEDSGRDRPRSLNLGASVTFTAAVMAFVVGATLIVPPGGRLAGGLLLASFLLLTVLFVAIDRRAAAPLLPREVTRAANLRQGAWGAFLNTATTSSAVTLVTLYLQNTLRRTPLQAAAALLPFSLAVIGGSALAPRLQRPLGPRGTMAIGLLAIAAADIALVWGAAAAWAVPLCAAVAGGGIGLSSVAATGVGTDVAAYWRGSASGIINTAAQLGTAVGIAILLLVAAATTGTPAPGIAPPRLAWAVAALTAAAGAAVFARPRRATPSPGLSGRRVAPPPRQTAR